MKTADVIKHFRLESRLDAVITYIETLKGYFDKDREFSELLQGKIDGKNSQLLRPQLNIVPTYPGNQNRCLELKEEDANPYCK